MKLFKSLSRWMRGLGHGRGFGVQSPFAYDFVTNVINQPLPYYAYHRLEGSFSLSHVEYKDCKLLLRLSNFLQPTIIRFDLYSERYGYTDTFSLACKAYLIAGCRTSSFVNDETPVDLEVINAGEYFRYNIRLASIKSVVVVVGIDKSDNWRTILSRKDVTFSFELYRICIIFFDPNFHHCNYLINY